MARCHKCGIKACNLLFAVSARVTRHRKRQLTKYTSKILEKTAQNLASLVPPRYLLRFSSARILLSSIEATLRTLDETPLHFGGQVSP
jgi:hypothetical protein